jgi:hypothetical protein
LLYAITNDSVKAERRFSVLIQLSVDVVVVFFNISRDRERGAERLLSASGHCTAQVKIRGRREE